MTTSAMIELAEHLAEAWRTGVPLPSLPQDLVPASAAAAYAAQDALAQMLVPRLGPIVGWKVGAPSPTAEPQAAPLLADLVQPSPARFAGARFKVRGLEAELAFRFARALPSRREPYSEAEVSAAIGSLHPAIELVESRLANWQAAPPLARLVDQQSNGGFCFGPGLAEWRAVSYAAQKASLTVDGQDIAEATGGNAAGHPLPLLVWIANHAGGRGRGLQAGDIVTTGSHTRLVFAAPTARVEAVFPGIGTARLDLVSD